MSREVVYSPRHEVPQFIALQNGQPVSTFSDLNSTNRATQRAEVLKANRWAGAFPVAMEGEKDDAFKKRVTLFEKRIDELLDLIDAAARKWGKERS